MRKAFALAAVLLTGCASTWQGIYAASTTSAEFVRTTHETAWSGPLNAKIDTCEAALPETFSQAEMDACLGEFIANPEVLAALERYNAAATFLKTVLLATDPDGDATGVVDAWKDVLDAAIALLELFPESEKYLRQLNVLTRRAK